MYRGNFSGWGYSPHDQVTPANVKKLVPVWTFSTGSPRDISLRRSSNNGVMFRHHAPQQVFAINAKTAT